MIRSNCDGCRQTVELPTCDVTVRICVDTDWTEYLFRCPLCRRLVVKPVRNRFLASLIEVGVSVVRWSLPAELREARSGPPITHDDLLVFHEAMRDAGTSIVTDAARFGQVEP